MARHGQGRVLELAQVPELSSMSELISYSPSSGFQAQSSSGHLKNEFNPPVWIKSFLFPHISHAGKANPALCRTVISSLSLNQKALKSFICTRFYTRGSSFLSPTEALCSKHFSWSERFCFLPTAAHSTGISTSGP